MTTHATPTTKITVKEQVKHKFADTQAFHDHLEYLGYSLEIQDDPDNDLVYAYSTYKPTLIVTIRQDWVSLVVRFVGYKQDAIKDVNFLQALNQINSTSAYSMWFATENIDDKSLTIVVFASYRSYEKISFGNFITIYEEEIKINIKNFADWLKPSDE